MSDFIQIANLLQLINDAEAQFEAHEKEMDDITAQEESLIQMNINDEEQYQAHIQNLDWQFEAHMQELEMYEPHDIF